MRLQDYNKKQQHKQIKSMTANPKKKIQKWNEEHDSILQERFQTDSLQDIADDLGFSRSTVQEHARQLGLRKEDPTRRNLDIREFIIMEYDNLTIKEMAKRTGFHKDTIGNIARSLGLRRTRPKWNENIRKARVETIKSERRRVVFGLEQRTRLKVVSNPQKHYLRQKMRQFGYIAAKGSNTVYYTDDTDRRPIRERNGERLGFKFKPLPAQCAEET